MWVFEILMGRGEKLSPRPIIIATSTVSPDRPVTLSGHIVFEVLVNPEVFGNLTPAG